MRADLLDAKAAVDWAVAQLPKLQERIITWRQSKPYSIVIDTDPKTGEKLYILRDFKGVDPIINAEAGVVINSILSSLDLLACALAARKGCLESKSTSFPIWKSEADFLDPKSKVLRKIKRLSQIDQDIIKNLRPYPGGNDLLYNLHEMDVTRKHRRLLSSYVSPRGILLDVLANETVPEVRRLKPNSDTVLVSTAAEAPDGRVSLNLTCIVR